MYIGKYHIGLRTIKTSLAVMCCIIFFHVTDRGTPMVATLSAVFALREDLPTTLSFSKSRILGNVIGGINAILFYYCQQLMPNQSIGEIILIPLFVGFTITLGIRMDNKAGIIGSVATLLFISFSIPKNESFLYALNRVIDTFIGALFAVFWNYVIKSPLEDKEKTVEQTLEQIAIKQREIDILQQDIYKMQKKSSPTNP
ncbi:MAG: FUSC family protein [Vagococcus sp.]